MCSPVLLFPTSFMVNKMHGKAPTVSCLFGPPRQKSYRMAVADVLRAVKREHGLSLVDLAERLGCCDQTIRNAMDEDGTDCLNAVTMLRIGYEFGEDALEPVFVLSRRVAVDAPTPTDRVERIERELAALLRECEG
jgi:predicted transcriptional regulator